MYFNEHCDKVLLGHTKGLYFNEHCDKVLLGHTKGLYFNDKVYYFLTFRDNQLMNFIFVFMDESHHYTISDVSYTFQYRLIG